METLLLKQAETAKTKYPNHIVIVHLNNYYQAFNEDANIVSELCNTPLTQSKSGYDITGFSHKKLEEYMKILIMKNGKSIAIVEYPT